MDKFRKHCLFVTLDPECFNDDLHQEILEIALHYGIYSYSSEDKNCCIFHSSSKEVLSRFHERLHREDFPIITEKFIH